MAPKSVLLLGAGELGGAILRSLTQHPAGRHTRVAVLKRSQQDGGLKELGVEQLTGNVASASVEQLAVIFSQFHTVVSTHSGEDRVALQDIS